MSDKNCRCGGQMAVRLIRTVEGASQALVGCDCGLAQWTGKENE